LSYFSTRSDDLFWDFSPEPEVDLPQGMSELVPWNRGGVQKWGLCESLLARSQACRHHDPEQMVLLAERAAAIAADLDPFAYGPEMTADLRARCLAELGNAYRVADDLEAAERALRDAIEESARGTQDPLLLARIMDLTASLRGAQRRFGEALELLDAVYRLYESHGDRHNSGRALISKGLYTGYDNDPEEAVRLLSSGLTLIHQASDPKLVISAVHNLITFLADCGRFREAQRILRRIRQAYDAEGDRLNLIKLRWVEGKIAAGLGRLRRAEQFLLQARQDLETTGLHYHAALASLDLAAVWLSQGKTAETRTLVGELVANFQARRIAREALAALVLLKEAFDLEHSEPLELLRAVSRYLKGSRQALAAH
jgi:tetratricopeptide (TPR) repeat protein